MEILDKGGKRPTGGATVDAEALLAETKDALASVESDILEREASIHAPLFAEQERVGALRTQAHVLRERINALKLERNDPGVYTPFGDAEFGQAVRLLVAVPVFIAGAVALPEHTVHAMVAGLVVAAVAIVRGLRNE